MAARCPWQDSTSCEGLICMHSMTCIGEQALELRAPEGGNSWCNVG